MPHNLNLSFHNDYDSTPSDIEQNLDPSTENEQQAAIHQSALSLLARREHSKKELKTKLLRQHSDEAAIEEEIRLLAEKSYQSEERFVEAFIRAKKSHGKGPLLIKQELRQRGVSEYLIASYVYERDDDWQELAQTVYTKKFGLHEAGDAQQMDPKEKARRIRFMVSRGFTPESVFALMSADDSLITP